MTREYGSGAIERRRNGFRYVIRHLGRKIYGPQLATREEAEQALQRIQEEIERNPSIRTGHTVQSWGERWLARRTNRNARDDENRWMRHIAKSKLADVPLRQLTRGDVKEWLQRLSVTRRVEPSAGGSHRRTREQLSPQTLRHCLNLLRRSLADALDDGLVQTNPAAGIRVPTPAIPDEPWTYLSAPEIGQLLDADLDEYARAAYTVAIYTGLRQGEMIGLCWRDVDLGPEPQITVRYSHSNTTKNRKIRQVPLLAPAAAALRRWLPLCSEWLPRRLRGSMPELVFPSTKTGKRWAKGHDFGWATARKGDGTPAIGWREQLGIREAVRFHDLRHTCASHLLMGTWGRVWRLEEVRELLGHSSITVTQRYAHISRTHLHEAARATQPIRSRDLHLVR